MLTLVTGAGGFVGRVLAHRMAETGYPGRVRLVDRVQPQPPDGDFEAIAADLSRAGAAEELARDADRVIHLAAVPSGASEADPALSRLVNLETSLRLIDALAARGSPARLVYASSIAVYGVPLPATEVDDDTPTRPSLTYGAHKLMVEIALADRVRRREIEGIAVRLPGIVARPKSADGFRSAFVSDIFWAVREGADYTLPVGPAATIWMMSALCCADNLIHAAGMTVPPDSPSAITLPALCVRMSDLVAQIAEATGGTTAGIRYDPVPLIERQFGSYPPLNAAAAERLGLRHDGSVDSMVRNAFRGV
ncbi:MAG: NAD-dependent epimerase/dehydratase family protein [Sphingomonadales bacterium]